MSTFSEKVGEQSSESQDGHGAKSKPFKEKTSKAESRVLQEAQRAAKAAAKGESLTLVSFSPLSFSSYLFDIFSCHNNHFETHVKLLTSQAHA